MSCSGGRLNLEAVFVERVEAGLRLASFLQKHGQTVPGAERVQAGFDPLSAPWMSVILNHVTIPKGNADLCWVFRAEGSDEYRFIPRYALRVSENSDVLQTYHIVIAEHISGEGPRMHGMIPFNSEPEGRPFFRLVGHWLEGLLDRRGLDLGARDIYDYPYGLSEYPRDWPPPPRSDAPRVITVGRR